MLTSDSDTAPDDLPFRSARAHARCLNGHLQDVAGGGRSHHRRLRLETLTCELCWSLRLPRSRWFVVEHATLTLPRQVAAHRRDQPVTLAARPPAVCAGVGRIELRIHGEVFGWVDVQLCGIERRGVLVNVTVADQHRRRGIGGVLLDVALARGPGYTWSTYKLGDGVDVRAFWASLDLGEPVQAGEPFYCSHVLQANGE